MKIFNLLICLLLVYSCGQNRGSQVIDPILSKYLEEVLEDVGMYGPNMQYPETVDSWEFADLSGKELAGLCQHNEVDDKFNISKTDVGRHILIDQAHWDNNNDFSRKVLLLHEMLHCGWKIGHQGNGVMWPHFVKIQNEAHYFFMIHSAAEILSDKQAGR